MTSVTRKTEVGTIDGTPEKRMFWSIISDYDLRTGLCELIDNALDIWIGSDAEKALQVIVNLDVERQLISVTDNAGGVRREDLRLLIVPGGSRNDPNAAVIGIFGVGSKRASIALGEQVEIRTRFGKQETFGIDITAEWLGSPEWEIAAYQLPDMKPGTTSVNISHLRRPFGRADVHNIRRHLGETYSRFIDQGCYIEVNEEPIAPHTFDRWAFPLDFSPRSLTFEASFNDRSLEVGITAGLITDREADADNYGVYFYCNNRLVVKELKTREVGYFISTEAGVPHPDASLCRAIVDLNGPAQLMPWNSSKSGINFDHPVFMMIRPPVIQLVSHFTKVSRRTKDDWPGKVYRYTEGEVIDLDPAELESKGKLILPSLPKGNKSHVDHLRAKNAKKLKDEPWTLGLVEGIAAVNILARQRFETKNRLALIILDSNFEIALKEFIVHRSDLFPPAQYGDKKIAEIFERRRFVIAEVVKKVAIPPSLIDKANHYYNLRNKLIHERASATVTDADVSNYQETVEKVLSILFKLKFA